jgi:hypothetical protein
MINAALPTNTPSIDIPEIMLMACIFFLEKRYRWAMYMEVFNLLAVMCCRLSVKLRVIYIEVSYKTAKQFSYNF